MVNEYFVDRDPAEKPVFEKLLTETKHSLPDKLLEFLPHFSFVMLKPDAYLRGLVPDILEFLVQNRVYPMKFTPMVLETNHIDNLYARFAQIWR